MPYYIFCSKCNKNGSYINIDRNCNKCSGTGNDWRDDKELENDRTFSVTLEQLKKESIVETNQGVKIFYFDEFPPIKEERDKVVSFKEEKSELENKKDIEKKDFEARIKFFISKFYLDNNNKLNLSSQNIKGEFDRISLNILFFGLDYSLLDRLKQLLRKLEKIKSSNLTDIEEILKNNPELIELFSLQEVFAHEYYHLIQFLTCQSVNNFYKASRKHNIIRAHVFSEAIRLNAKFDLSNSENKSDSIFSIILKFNDESVKKYFFDVIKNSRMESLIVKNFYDYKSNKSDFSMLDIFEGSAYSFQKIVNRTINVDTFKIDKESPEYKKYKGARDYFATCNGTEEIIFFIMTYQSLKYGILDDGDYMNVVPIPQDIFIFLCKNIYKYEKELNNNLLYRPFLVPTEFEDLNISEDKKIAIFRLVKIFDMIKEDIKEYSKKTNTYYDENIFEREISYNDTTIYSPLKNIFNSLLKDYPVFETKYFLPTLLVDYSFYVNFILGYLEKSIRKIEFKGIFGGESYIESDHYLLKVTDDFDRLIRTGWTNCCKDHTNELVDIDDVFYCNSENSLKNRIKFVSGKSIEDLIPELSDL